MSNKEAIAPCTHVPRDGRVEFAAEAVGLRDPSGRDPPQDRAPICGTHNGQNAGPTTALESAKHRLANQRPPISEAEASWLTRIGSINATSACMFREARISTRV